jgi:glutathione peroxidase
MKLELFRILLLSIVIIFQLVGLENFYPQNIKEQNLEDDINDIIVMDMENNSIRLSDYNDKVLLIVNVASECGYTPQYKGLEEIYQKYNSLGFEILAFPCNDFGGQEPGTNEEIKAFCSSNYNVTFMLFDKINVLGEEKSPLYERLTNNSITDKSDINWNFEKFIISKGGKIKARFLTKIEPTDEAITKLIEQELEKK